MKNFKVTHESGWEMRVQVDEEKAKDAIKDMVEFWCEYEFRLALNEGDYLKTFLQQLGRKVYVESLYRNTVGIIHLFENEEGWTKMDGSEGILILDTDTVDIDERDFEITGY